MSLATGPAFGRLLARGDMHGSQAKDDGMEGFFFLGRACVSPVESTSLVGVLV